MRVLSCFLLATLLLTGCGPVLVADDARKREVVARQHAELWTRGRIEVVDELFTEDFLGHFPGAQVEGRAALKAYVQAQREKHPDWAESMAYVIVEGNRAASRGTVRGVRPGPGRHFEVEQGSLFEFRGGRIAEQWMFLELGAPPDA